MDRQRVDMPPSSANPPRLRALAVLRLVLTTFRLNARRIAVAAVVLLVPLNLIANATATEVDTASDHVGVAVFARITLALLGGFGAALGTVCFAGLLDQLVGERLHGRSRRGLGAVLRGLPFGRLLLASFLLAGVLVVGLLFFIVPDLIGFTLFVLVGPLIAEGSSVPAAFRRSARLVRPHLWLVLGVITMPMLAAVLLDDALEAMLRTEPPLFGVFVVNGLVAATVGALTGLVEVVLTDELLTREAGSQPDVQPVAPPV